MIGYSKVAQVGVKKKSQTEKNVDANKELDRIYAEKGVSKCELLGIVKHDCIVSEHYSNGELLKLTYAHRHKRIWYKQEGREKLLHSYHETIRACVNGHMILEADRVLTNKVFTKLRGTGLSRKAGNV